MNFLFLHLFVHLLIILKISNAIDLKCEFSDSGYIGKRCNLVEKTPILPYTEEEGYTFTDISDKQKKAVRGIRFYTSNIAFLPNETLSTFPNLDAIWVSDADLKVLNFDFLTNLLKFAPNVRKLSLWNCGINQIDPQVIPIFEKLLKVDLRGNECVNKDFDDLKDFPQMSLILESCTNNFKTENPSVTSGCSKKTKISDRSAFGSDDDDDDEIERLQSEVATHDETLNSIKVEISEFKNEVNSELQKEIADLKSQNTQIENKVLTQISEIKQEISSNIEKKNSEIQSEITKLKTDGVMEIESEITELKNNIMKIKTEQEEIIVQLKDEISKLQASQTKFENEFFQR